MLSEEFGHQHDAMARGDIREPDQARVADTVPRDERPEILVQGHHYPVFDPGAFEQRPITGVGANLPPVEHIVPLL